MNAKRALLIGAGLLCVSMPPSQSTQGASVAAPIKFRR
jgi:hypothetical protein